MNFLFYVLLFVGDNIVNAGPRWEPRQKPKSPPNQKLLQQAPFHIVKTFDFQF